MLYVSVCSHTRCSTYLTFVHSTQIIYTDSSLFSDSLDFSTPFRPIMRNTFPSLSAIALLPLLPFLAIRKIQVLFCRYVIDRAERREERMHRRKAKRLPERLRKRYLRSVGL
jgi:hypothetical protein